ncbi:MAG: metallophosphoesterase [Erysipelotrichaceae bacterium]|nr:metallophosphoesterase [Erysipelotrichaceae bacterium]
MRILLVADHEETSLWDYYRASKTEGVDLILSCGDLDPDYLEFLVTMVNKPLLYVRGNHDDKYETHEPLGCDCIEDSIYDFHGLRILGLGGSYKYGNRKNMYTEADMEKRIQKLKLKLKLMNGFDVLLTHAPAYGYGDLDDLPHKGFECFNDLIEQYHPAYMFHGHVHAEYGAFKRERIHSSGTRIINGYGSWMVDIDENEYPAQGHTGSKLYDWYAKKKYNL